MSRPRAAAMLLTALLGVPQLARAQDTFEYEPAGELAAGSGTGRADSTLYAPDIRFPIEAAPAFANSQVWGNGGGQGEGSQCDEVNFSYPWRDNFCESRTHQMPLCPSGTGHQGQDIRGASCEKAQHWVVAVADGTITQVGSYSVYLTTEEGTRFDYLHMSDVQVEEGETVTRGQRIGKVSNVFGGTPTTVHLHFNVRQNVAGVGMVFVPPYASLVDAYDRLLNPRPDAGPPDAGRPDAGRPERAPRLPEPADAAPPLVQESPSVRTDDDSGCHVSAAAAPGGFAGRLLVLLVALIALVAVGRRQSSGRSMPASCKPRSGPRS